MSSGRIILAIDPGNIHSGYCVIDYDTYKPLEIGKIDNEDLRINVLGDDRHEVVIEMIASYGMAVGQTVFDTCVWVGRYYEKARYYNCNPQLMYRKDVKMNLCGQTRAKDSNIRQALVDRFSYDRHAAKGGKGTKADPGFFFGFKSDIWAAYGVGVTYIDQLKEQQNG